MNMPKRYPRNMIGYGAHSPNIVWPKNANIAVQFVLNYEEGGENNILHGDAGSEAFLSEIVGASSWPDQRHYNMESIYEYGARAGFWRLHLLFTQNNIPVTVYGVATALARSPEQVAAMQEANWEIASHGYKWIEYKDFSIEEESEHIEKAIAIHKTITGDAPKGWYTGRCSINTVDLASKLGAFDYISDAYDDDLPYWKEIEGKAQLIIPYTLDANDMRFATPQGFNSGDQFFTYLKDSFDCLYEEGKTGAPKMMNIGLHCRLIGRPGRIMALKRFIDYIQSFENVWIARRIDIAKYWHETYPYVQQDFQPSKMNETEFVDRFGGVFEHSPWIAKGAYHSELGAVHDRAIGLHNALCQVFRSADEDKRLGVLLAHPDLAGKLAAAKRLTAESTAEQAGAGLDMLTDQERADFENLNTAYTEKFGFPFIIAVKGLDKTQILAAFNTRIKNDRATELDTACRQVERIALLRLKEMLP